MPIQKTTEQYKQELSEKNPHITLIDEYRGSAVKILHKCNYCGKEWKILPSNALRGVRCKSCRQTKTHSQYVEELRLINPTIKILDEYTGTNNQNTFECLSCGYIWKTTPSNPLRGKGCKKCGSKHTAEILRRTKEEFEEKLHNVFPNIDVKDYPEEIGNHKILVVCNVCNHEWYTYKNSILQGHGCPICSRNNTRVPEKVFYERIAENTPEVEILTPYTKGSARYKCRCKICGHEWESSGSNLMRGKSGCRECYKNRKFLTEEEFYNRLHNIHGDDIIPLEEYKGRLEYMDFKCNKCGNIWNTSTNTVLNGSGCPICGRKKLSESLTKTHEQFIKEVNIVNQNIKIRGKYRGANNSIEVECSVCGHIWTPKAGSVLSGYGCPKCSGNYRDLDMLVEDIAHISPTIQILSTKYVNALAPLECLCLECGNKWVSYANKLKNGIGCPICNMSHGENRIFVFLQENNIASISGKTFPDLIGTGGGLLSYDFFLSEYNILMEYQGQQHEKDMTGSLGKSFDLEKQQEHDRRKKEYALSHGYNFLEIWYYDFDNIEKILTNYLNLESVETVTES